MKLTDLEPSFLTVITPGKTRQHHDDLSKAQGIFFLCPLCFVSIPSQREEHASRAEKLSHKDDSVKEGFLSSQANGGAVGTHGVVCWFRDRAVPDVEEPRPARWQVSGTDYQDLTLHPSIAITSGCKWHGWIEKGEIR